jgi:hypothetical protein
MSSMALFGRHSVILAQTCIQVEQCDRGRLLHLKLPCVENTPKRCQMVRPFSRILPVECL